MKNEYKILIIEDDVPLNDMTKRLLTQHGYCVTSAYSGLQSPGSWAWTATIS